MGQADAATRTGIAIIGTGFSGLGVAMALKRERIEDFVILERRSGVGGTWHDNRYPGCQCDVPSHLYSFSFRPNPEWSRTYSTQPEIERYLRRCADESGVLPHVRFDHDVLRTRWDDEEQMWFIETNQGTWAAEKLIGAWGGLAEPAFPDLPGLDSFRGRVMHSAAWDQDVSLEGKRVAVVGTGASAIQIVPQVQPQVDKLYVFQRTPAWVLPHTDRPITERERNLYRRFPLAQKAVRGAIYAARELMAIGMTKNPRYLAPLRALALRHLRTQVRDRGLRRKLAPSYSPGCKRLLLSNDYYPALDAANAELVTEPIQELRGNAIVTGDGSQHEVDVVVFATGFRVTDNPMKDRIFGSGGRSLTDAWRDTGLTAYLGTTTAGFPNLFLMTGPNTGIGHTSLVVMIESQIRYVIDCLRYMQERSIGAVEVRREAQDRFNEGLQDKMARTVWTTGGCASWYIDEHGKNSTLWPDFTWRFRLMTRRFDPAAYALRPARPARQRQRVPA